VIIIFGSNATLDANMEGRFFTGDGSNRKTSLKNENADHVSKH
jgi:hypothetical protein